MTPTPNPAVDRVFSHVVAEYPHLAPACLAPADSPPLPHMFLAQPDTLDAATAASRAAYSIDNPRHAAQVWWYSLCNSLTRPSLTAAVEMYTVPLLDLEAGQLFAQPARGGVAHYWFGFTPGARVSAADIEADDWAALRADSAQQHPRGARVHAALGDLPVNDSVDDCEDPDTAAEILSWVHTSRHLCRTLAPIVSAVATHTGITAPTLWAVLADAVLGGCASAGNDSFDPARGILAAEAMAIGAGSLWPAPRFDAIRGNDYTPLHATDPIGDDDHVLARRASCCMIFHSTTSGKCLSCPKQRPEHRQQALIDYVAGLP